MTLIGRLEPVGTETYLCRLISRQHLIGPPRSPVAPSTLRPFQARGVTERPERTVLGPCGGFLGRRQPDAKPGRVSERSHGRNVFDGREMPCNGDCAPPDIERQSSVTSKLDQKSSSPQQRSRSFSGYGHDLLSEIRLETACSCAPNHVPRNRGAFVLAVRVAVAEESIGDFDPRRSETQL